ncbi:MAG: hypothetical protein GX596_02475 [Propionibacterium sp.]|nr:hypothetical protein [Propionibacterium sp.]
MRTTQATRNPVLSGLALALLVVGLAEAATVGWLVARDGAAALSSTIASPVLLWPVWVGVILTVLSPTIHQPVRYVVALGALVAASFRAGLQMLVLGEAPPVADPAVLLLQTASPVAGSAILAVWAIVDALRRRPVVRVPLPAPSRLPQPIGAVPVPRRFPSSPTTPVTRGVRHGAPAAAPDPVWKRVGSPWPRAVEDDPDGTLLRPPRRKTRL